MHGEGAVDLRPDEEVIGLVRCSLLAELPRFVFAVTWILLPWFFFFPLLGLGSFGWLLFLILLLSGVYYFTKLVIVWRYTMLILTDSRIIDVEQYGIFKRQVSELGYQEIVEVNSRCRGLWNRLVNIGKVRVNTNAATGYDLEIGRVRRPAKIRDLILDIQSMMSSNHENTYHYQSKDESK